VDWAHYEAVVGAGVGAVVAGAEAVAAWGQALLGTLVCGLEPRLGRGMLGERRGGNALVAALFAAFTLMLKFVGGVLETLPDLPALELTGG
jgi:hypothetical protein